MAEADEEVVVRLATAADVEWADRAAALIDEASHDFDIARREVGFLRDKIEHAKAVLGTVGDRLVAFGYWSDWEGGRFVSHSGLVVSPEFRGQGLGRRLKLALFESSRRRFPEACLMSLTSSAEVKALNRSLGFRVVPIDELTSDPAFWKGCETCRNYDAVRARGERCCCEAMLLRPDSAR